MIHEKVLFVFYLLTLCNCLLILWEFLSWKKNFWHHPNISPGLTWKNTLMNWQHILFIWIWNVWMMSDTVNFLKKIHEPFMASWPPKSEHYQNEETRNWNFKNLYLNVFLTKLLMEFLQFMIIRRISTTSTLKIFYFITFRKKFYF